ncbi:Na+/H+ antiporter NhaC family protein [Mitsuokella multacida]|jgi:tetracycline resistance efflux pump|uniref:Na+/H+ antiporter NhaC family protein n=2 Tax=Mitsuokella multacida TaxID=52226 RepID=A0A414NXI5_9FIRM|nr:Na+/H+ antiporter NhaC family protein [Mitsuokella multacida]RHF52094.1 Na+/H+ antiporter NhaC family protein [Mitsuokella multacida]
MAATAWSILPPVITIVLALWTKEVYMSLIIGIFSGALLFTGGNILESILTMFTVMSDKVGSNVNILVFLVILGILVAAISRSGATRAYGEWASKTIKGQRSALLLTALLGIVIFIDDYFNCLTVGTVMRPVTDKLKVARTKLAYIIDATAAPVCIIAPVSSWAAAVGSSLPEDSTIDGFSLFLQTIPFNLYAWLTILFMLFIIWTARDFAAMGESIRENSKKFVIPKEYADAEQKSADMELGHGKIIDLILPLIVLIAACVYGMLYTGGIHEGKTIAEAFANCDSAKSLVLGSFIAFVFTGFLYLPRRIISFNAFCDSFGWGFKAMTPAIFILCLAWTLSGICSKDYLNLGGFVGAIVSAHASIIMFLPPIFFLVAAGLAFATGTSWGTFGILIPIAIAVLGMNDPSMLVVCVAAVLSGAVCGDHASPISDTTILASAGAQCHHIDHVSTQLPYVGVVATCSFFGYIVDGLTENGWLGLLTGIICLAIAMVIIRARVPVIDAEKD